MKALTSVFLKIAAQHDEKFFWDQIIQQYHYTSKLANQIAGVAVSNNY